MFGKEEVIQQLVPHYKIDAFAKLYKTTNYVIPGTISSAGAKSGEFPRGVTRHV